MSFPVVGSNFDSTLVTSTRSNEQSEVEVDSENSFLGQMQSRLGARSTSGATGNGWVLSNESIAHSNLPRIAYRRTQTETNSDQNFVNAFQTDMSWFDSRVDRSLIGDTTKSVPLQQEFEADKIPPIDQYESTRIFAKFVFEEQARIAREIESNDGKVKLRGEEYDINKTSGTMQLNFFLTEAQTALGAMQRMLSSYRDWEKRAVEFLG